MYEQHSVGRVLLWLWGGRPITRSLLQSVARPYTVGPYSVWPI